MKGRLTSVLRHLRRVVVPCCEGGLTDAQLLQRFAKERDAAAFEVLVWRHGPMVLAVGHRVLHNLDDAEDVLQATFLVLARQARSITRGEALASWLYKVAHRTALRAREQRKKRLLAHLDVEQVPAPPANPEDPSGEVLPILDEELQRLPQKYRTPLVLSYLQGLTNQEIATQLDCPIGTVFTRLARGREMLRRRLSRRGVTCTAGMMGAALATTPLRAGLVQATLKAVRAFVAGFGPAAGVLSPNLLSLTEGVLKMMWLRRLRFIGATLMLIALAGSGTALLALRGMAREQGSDPNIAGIIEQPAEGAVAEGEPAKPAAGPPGPGAPKESPEYPHVVQVIPANGATDVEPISEIHIRFDRPMDPTKALLNWVFQNKAGFRLRGELRYVEATREFILPVQLTAGSKHEVTLNREGYSGGKDKDYEGFQSRGGVAAKTFHWSFATAKLPSREGKPPHVTSVAPASDTEVSLITPLVVAFDQPMDPLSYGLGITESMASDQSLELLGRPEYDAERHRFTLLARLPPNWNGELRLEGFRGKDGAVAEPVVVKYRTLRSILSDSLIKRIAEAGRSAELRRLVERVCKARRDLTSVSEQVLWTHSYGYESPDWHRSFDSKGARFAMRDGKKFLGIIDGIMRMPFRIGSDGETCWFRHGNERVSLPAKDMTQKHVLICDPFDAASKADTEKVIQDLKLEYLGEATVRGRRCYRVRSWEVSLLERVGWLTPVRDWFFDADSLLPLRVQMGGTGVQAIDYDHSRINQAIPDEEFRPESGPDIKAMPVEPLAEGYTTRFLNVNDGSSGRMSVRWGMKGPKGMSSSGLN
jgi:RNA polymerase sigma-70 factor (ECF subfamily)